MLPCSILAWHPLGEGYGGGVKVGFGSEMIARVFETFISEVFIS